jgi:ectoine hydroxylase-related dioxygenase (phytanoyl-CoA dioxygenase family)
MRYFLGNDIVGLQSQFFFSKPGTKGFAVHQDNFFIEAKNNSFASVWCPLVDVAILNGCLYIFPGSNNEGLLPVEPVSCNHDIGQDRNANNEECVVPSKFKQFDVIMKKGSALFIHGNLAHGSHGNQSTEHRYVSLNTYIIQGESFRPGLTAKREEIPL